MFGIARRVITVVLSLITLCSCIATATDRRVMSIVSSIASDPSVRLSEMPPIPFTSNTPPPDVPVLSFDSQQRYQQMEMGFGGAFTQAAGSVFAKLPNSLQQQLIHAYFNRTSGHGYNIGRVPINSCDYSQFTYSYDDTRDDYELKHFDYAAKVDSTSIIPFIQAAMKVTNTRSPNDRLLLFSAPWSPPAWMKNSQQMNGSSTPCLIDDPRIYTAWAQYLVNWFRVYQSFNIPFWGLSIQNEPLNNPPWEGCIYSAQQQLDFMLGYLLPALNQSFPHLKIMAWDFNKDGAVNWINIQFSNVSAYDQFWGTSVHWYAGALLDQMDIMHDKWPNKRILATESCICPDVHLNDWSRGEQYFTDIVGDLNHWSVGYTDWNLILDHTGGPTHVGESCDGAVIARFDLNPVVLNFQPMYFAMGHFSRFLSRDSQRVHSQLSTNSTLQYTTWIKGDVDEEIVVIVLMNDENVDQKLSVQAGLSFATIVVPAHSMHSITFPASLLQKNTVATSQAE